MFETMKEIVIESPAFYIGWGGLLIGFAFGFIVYRTNFCTMGSLSDILTFGNFNRFRAWMLAIAVAIVGVIGLGQAGVANVADSMYLTPNLGWAANIVGGLMFGFGMVYSGGCVGRNIVRAGAGDLRSVMILTITGVFAFMTIGGLLGPLRIAIFSGPTLDLRDYGLETQSLGEIFGKLAGISTDTGRVIVAAAIVAALLFFVFKDKGFRGSKLDMIAGFGIGFVIIAGWMLTGLAQDEFADVPVALVSLSYVRPTGDTLDYMMRFTALGAPKFAVVTLVGALLGGLVGALSKGQLRITTFADSADTVRNMSGAALMGVGGVLALGCTIGQGLTGVSTLAVGSFIAVVGIIIGGIAGMKTIEFFA